MGDNEIKLILGVPTQGMHAGGFSYSLCGLMGYLSACGIRTLPEKTLSMGIDIAESSCIHSNREAIVMRAIESGKTHLVFLDNDMVFEPNILDILGGRRKEVVACNYLRKVEDELSFVAVGLSGNRIPTTEQSAGLVPIMYSGFGVSWFDLEAFKRTPQPWFLPVWVPESRQYTTEDNPCFQRLRAAGAEVYLDQDASKLVTGHIGSRAWAWNKPAPMSKFLKSE